MHSGSRPYRLQWLLTQCQSMCVFCMDHMMISLSSDGLIKAVGPAETIRAQYAGASFDKVIDATGMCVLPGEYQLIGMLGFT